MRILHIHSGNLYGGVETALRTMARVSVPGVEPEFAVCFDGRIAAELRAAGRRVHVLGAVRASRPVSVVQARARLAAICSAGRFDAVVAHSTWSMAMLAPAAPRPLIYYQHDVLSGRPWTERWARHTLPDLVIANSDFTARSTGLVYPQCPVVRVYPPVELSSPRPRRKVTDRMVILQAGRFEKLKGQALLLEALGRMAGDPRWVLWIAGGAQRPAEKALALELQSQARSLGIERRVLFLGHVTDMPDILASSDIYCQPNTGPESFGLSYIEALHAGLPVVATDLGGAREILAPDWGVLVEPNPEAVVKGLRRILDGARWAEAGSLRAAELCDAGTQIQAFADAIRGLREAERRLNVAMLSFRLPATGSKRGGVERVAHDLADGLARRGHHVTVWSADPAPAGACYDVRPLPFRRLIQSWLGFRLVSGYLGNILALLPDYAEAEVIVAHGDSLLLPLRGIPVVRIMHGSALDEARTARSWLRKILQFGVYWQECLTVRTQHCVAISRNTQGRYPAIRESIPNGVDLTRFFPAASEKSPQPSILFVGTLGGRKRGALLLQWFVETIRPSRPDAVLWMVSETGPAEEGVTYFSGIGDDELAALYRRAWVFASPSVYEGFGLPHLEAMASGTPVVGTANPGSREVCVGGLVDRDADFAPAVLEMLRRPRGIEEGLRRARELSLDRMVERYEAAIRARLNRGHERSEMAPVEHE